MKSWLLPRIECLEGRIAPATLVAVDGANHLLIFDSDASFDFDQVNITGLSAGESVLALDFRPVDGHLYGLASSSAEPGHIYRLDVASGLATLVSTLRPDPNDTTSAFSGLSGTRFDIDFDPVSDELRVVSDTGQNLHLRFATGFTTTDTALAFTAGDTNAGQVPTIRGIGYSNATPGATETSLFAIDTRLDTVAMQNPPDTGSLHTSGTFEFFNPSRVDGFDVAPGSNVGYSVTVSNGETRTAQIDIVTGHLLLRGIVSPSDLDIRSLAVAHYHWTGAGMDGNTSNPDNWVSRLPLSVAAQIVLPAGVTNKAIINDSGVFFPLDSILLQSSGYTFEGGALGAQKIVATNATGSNSIGASDRVLRLFDAATVLAQNTGTTLIIPGAISPEGGTVTLDGAGDFKIHALQETGSLVKTGSGKAVVDLSTLSGPHIVREGTLILNFVNPGTTVSVEGGVLGGGLFPKTTATGGIISPGDNSRTLLTVQGGFNLGSGANLAIELEGVAGDSVRVFDVSNDGDVILSGTLSVSRVGNAPLAQSYTILDKRSGGAISGTFSGLPEGANLVLGADVFRISYTGGDGNDVVLTRLDLLPPTLSADRHSVTFTDADGDRAKVQISRGQFDLANNLHFARTANGYQLQEVIFTGAGFSGTNLVASAAPDGPGDGRVDIGHISAAGVRMGSVMITGDLGRIHAGTVNVLRAFSLGAKGIGTQGSGGDLHSTITGGLGRLHVTTDVSGADLSVSGSASFPRNGLPRSVTIGEVRLGGSLIGDAGGGSGAIVAAGRIEQVNIEGSVIGGDGAGSGTIHSTRLINSMFIGGSLEGGSGATSGKVSGDVGILAVNILGNIVGGDGESSGQLVSSMGAIVRAQIGGSIEGGAGEASGLILAGGGTSNLAISGRVAGGAGERSASIETTGSFGRITIGGSVASGSGFQSGSIFAASALGKVRIAGEVRGTSASPLRLIVGGINLPGALALSSLEIGGGMHFAEVLGGYKLDGPLQANVNFGVILVRGSWEASSIAVGVESGTDGLFGTNDDVAIGGGLSNVGHLARVIIGGSATGTTQADDSFGISARRIGALTVGPRAISLTAGLDVSLLAATGDFFAREVPGV